MVAQGKGIRKFWNPKKILLVESGILGFGIRNTARVIRNPNSMEKGWNPESKIVFDLITWVGIGFYLFNA